MAKTDTQADQEPEPQAPESLEHGTYEVIRGRLTAAAEELRTKLEKLNAARKETFGAIDTKLLATERVTTENNCTPRDMTPVGNRFLFGYNVRFGLKAVTTPADVFAVYGFSDHTFTAEPPELIADEQFERDFAELFRYYRNTVFARFARIGAHLFMVFRTSGDVRDVKTFKWLVRGDKLAYVDNRSDQDYRFPPQHEFRWTRTNRDMHAGGLHPHVNIEDRVFVEAVGGDLTVKIEDNTATGEGIYAEPVDDPDQTLDDAEILYALVGNLVLMKVRPYREEAFRYLVYSEKTRSVRRLDAIENACVLLPDDHGIIFANGYFLQTGECKVFENQLADMMFSERVASPNGEDYLYVFYNRLKGIYVLLPYNVIQQKVGTPVICHGYSLFADGTLIYFKGQPEPQKHHALQIWQTPFVGPDFEVATQADSYLYKVGNRDIVRGMAECYEVLGLIGKEDTYSGLFVDLAKKTAAILDAYYWLGHEDAFNPREVLLRIKEAADAAIEEFEKVVAVRRSTEAELRDVTARTREIAASVHSRRFEVIGDFVTSLADLRTVRGEIISLENLRYIDEAAVDALESEVGEHTDRVARDCVRFLLKPESLAPYAAAVDEHASHIAGLKKVAEARELEKKLAASAGELEMLIEITSNLQIDDATQRTEITDRISAIFAELNQTRAKLKTRMQDLGRAEGAAEFASQLKLVNQGVAGYLDVCDTPERCEEYLTKMMVQLEELEGRFAEFDEFVLQLADKREEVYNAFETRKVQLIEARNKRATALAGAADRILSGIKARVGRLETIPEINGYYASDLMIEKVRDIVRELEEMGDTVKVDDIQSRLKTIREDAVRQLKDRQDLYEDGEGVIRLGNHRFSVNRQAFDLTSVLRDGQMYFHLTGTNYFDPVTDADFLETRPVWSQEVVSETADVYRAEYLAYQMVRSLGTGDLPDAAALAASDDAELKAAVQRFMGPRYSEGYVKGVHDHDGAILLGALAELETKVGLLRYHPRARALASVFWHQFPKLAHKELLVAKLLGYGQIEELFPDTGVQERYVAELEELIAEHLDESGTFPAELVPQAAEYLFHELTDGAEGFVISATARNLYHDFQGHLEQKFYADKYRASIAEVHESPEAVFLLQRDWVTAFLTRRDDPDEKDYADEVAALLTTESFDPARVADVPVVRDLEGMVGNHPRVVDGTYRLNYHDFRLRLARHEREVVPRFEAYGRLKQELLEHERDRMRLDEFRPRVLTSFVRNKLIDGVYLPLLGDNLAKQVGTAGEAKRTDRMGLLLLISPPGYGKTTLMEYMANRLGIVFMKINGPALGHQVTSLDPSGAPNAAAREELEKLNLAFEMGDNVMIYLDDIQHCNPELLQKFISLCDAQRKVEGVFRGKTRTYDLRGKKVCVVMAGNPYTESGEKFKIPDMLANRADTYNLGEIIGPNADLFESSYLENCITSNPVLNKLAARSQKDVHGVIRMARENTTEGIDLEGSYSLAEVNEMVAVMKKLLRVRDVVLAVNREYIRSAGTADEYRTEPAFKLQGSYRNMNRIAERVVAVMNDRELEELILAAYQNDAQTLTTGTEANMLKFKELTGRLTPEEAQRWDDIKRTFRRNVRLRGAGEDEKFGQMIVELSSFSEGLEQIRRALDTGLDRMIHTQTAKAEEDGAELKATFAPETLAAVGGWIEELKASYQQAAAAAGEAQKPQEVHVVSKVPTSILHVLRHQFRLMQAWLEPMHQQTRKQAHELEELRQVLDDNLGGYKELIQQLEEALRRGDLLYENLAKHKIETEKSQKPGKGTAK